MIVESKQMKGPIPQSNNTDTMDMNKKPLSFSISRILEGTDTKPAAIIERQSRDTEEPRVPVHFGTVHHYAPYLPVYGQNHYDYAHFESTVRPRACSTPENEEYPSPTPVYHPRPMVYHHQVSSLTTPNSDSPCDLLYRPERSAVFKVNFDHVDEPSEKSLDSLGESYQQSPSPFKMKSKKKTRTVFSRSQVYQLESAFEMKRYLSSGERSGLAARLKLSETQIKIWFQNRRNKWKRQINGEMDEIPVPPQYAAGYLTTPFCPPSLTPYGREELMRSSMAAPPTYYSHPYAQDSRLRSSIL